MDKSSFEKGSPIVVIVNTRGKVTTLTMRRTHALPPHPDWQRYGYVLTAIFLHDIELDGAPMLVCPGSQNQLDKVWARYPGRAGGMGIPDLREFKGELADPVPLTAKAGSVVVPIQLLGSRRTTV